MRHPLHSNSSCSANDDQDTPKSNGVLEPYSNPPHIQPLGLPANFSDFSHLVTNYNLLSKIESTVIYTEYQRVNQYPHRYGYLCTRDYDLIYPLWTTLFTTIRPTRIMLAARPSTLGLLVNQHPHLDDVWLFDMSVQYLELLMPSPYSNDDVHALRSSHKHATCEGPRTAKDCSPSLLLSLPWTHLSFNEGSSLPVYSTYEHYSKRAPNTLSLILRSLAKEISGQMSGRPLERGRDTRCIELGNIVGMQETCCLI